MLRFGCIVLTVWGSIHLVASALSLAASLLGRYAPILKMVFTDPEIAAYDQKMLTVTKSLAVMHNTGAMIFGALILVLTWCGINPGSRWAFWTLLAAGVVAQGMWFVADSFIGNRTLAVNIVLTGLLLAGAALTGYSLYRS